MLKEFYINIDDKSQNFGGYFQHIERNKSKLMNQLEQMNDQFGLTQRMMTKFSIYFVLNNNLRKSQQKFEIKYKIQTMPKSFSFLSILLILAFFSAQVSSYTCKEYIYDYSMLVLYWPTQYCYHHQDCKQNWKDLVLPNQLVIDGYWPASRDIDYLNCIQFEGQDPNCQVDYKYNDALIPVESRVELNKYWPEIMISNDLKEDQWYQHGTCYIQIIEKLNNSYIGNEQKLFEQYFKSSVKKAKQIQLSLNKTEYQNKQDLAQALGIKPQNYHALCEFDNDYLSEVRICYDIKGNTGTQALVACPTDIPYECEFPIKVRAKFASHVHYLIGLAIVLLALLF